MRITELALLFAAASCGLAKHGAGDDGDDGPDVPSSTAPAPTSSSASPSPTTTTSLFQFLPPSNATTCQNITLEWQSANVSVPLTLTITNERATASGSPSGANTTLVSHTLATNVSAAAGQFAWRSVDVPQGSYVAVAFDTARTAGIFVQSPLFFVQTGHDSSCLAAAAAAAPSSSLASGSGSGASPSPTSSSASESSSSSESSGGGAGAQPKNLSPAVLGGVVAGVVVGVLLLILAATFPHYWKAALVRRRRNRHPGGPYHLF
ncbi:hypothetical protein LXA43DRAFT_1125746 [Ganoderma leucocontextum]|nr:hypothetical protein LXA43DRAFT_1125746 [Ganoderma leucocontextum]